MLDVTAKNVALVIVDMQNDFVRIGGAMEVPDTRKTLAPIQKLIAFAREKNIPIIYPKFASGPKPILLWNWSPQIPQQNAFFRGQKRYYEEEGKELLTSDVVSELQPLPQDYQFDKYGYSAFRNSPLTDIMRSEERDSAIIVGTVTQICVEDTVHDAFHLGFKVWVASDGVSSFDEEMHRAALTNFNMKYGDVMTTDEILEKLG